MYYGAHLYTNSINVISFLFDDLLINKELNVSAVCPEVLQVHKVPESAVVSHNWLCYNIAS